MGEADAAHLVELRGVRKAFGDNLVLDGIDLAVARGEAIVIAGPSGSGKSTMLRCINALEEVDEGEILFDGRSVTSAGKGITALRAEIGMVFQQFNLFPHRSVLDNITLAPVQAKGESTERARERAKALLERVDAAEHRRLAGPRRAGDDDGLARVDRQVDAVEDDVAAEALRHVLQDDQMTVRT